MLQRRLDDVPEEINKATRALRQERDRLVHEERRASTKAQQRCQVRKMILYSPVLLTKAVCSFLYYLSMKFYRLFVKYFQGGI